MKIMIDKNSEISISYTTLNYGKIVVEIDSIEAENIAKAILEWCGAYPIACALDAKEDLEMIMETFDFEDVMNYYGVSKVAEWSDANR